MAYDWQEFTDTLDGTRPITKAERDELWDALADLLDRCGGRWRLKSADMTAIKASLVLTDLTSLEQSAHTDTTEVGDLAKVLIDIEDTFSGTTGYAAFQHVAPDEGLTSAQLAEFIGAGGRATVADAYHLWNLYKRVLDYLSCCPTSTPVFEWDSVSASKTKCGTEDPAHPTTPPTIFRKIVSCGGGGGGTPWGGGLATSQYDEDCVEATTHVCSTACIHSELRSASEDDPLAEKRYQKGTTAAYSHLHVRPDAEDGWTGTYHLDRKFIQQFVATGADPDAPDAGPCFVLQGSYEGSASYSASDGGISGFLIPGTGSAEVVDAVNNLWSGSFTDGDGHTTTWDHVHEDFIDNFFWGLVAIPDSIWVTDDDEPESGYFLENEIIPPDDDYSDEYTEAELITNTTDALPDFDGDWDDTAGSYRNLSSPDEATLSLRTSKARVSLAGLTLGVGQQYRAVYFRRFTPLDGGAPTDGDEEYIEFTFAEDMAHTDEIEIPVPDTNGTNTLVPVRWECAPFDDEEGGE